jgi:arginase family enzyme
MSRLRARCPDCRTLTAVALGDEYECHACGRVFGAGLVRVPRAWGSGGNAMAKAAELSLGYPEVAVIEEASLVEQSRAIAAAIPARPVVLGGCCCAHVGVSEGLAARYGRLAVAWLDAHGDLNTPESSPSGNEWGMALRMLIDGGAVAPCDVVLIGARNLDAPEAAFIADVGLSLGAEGIDETLGKADAVYVAFDVDVLDAGEGVAAFFPEPAGLTMLEAEALLRRIAASTRIAGAGLSGLLPEEDNVAPITRLCVALGL